MVLPLLQSLGLPEEVLEVVRARIATQKPPKKVSREKQLSFIFRLLDYASTGSPGHGPIHLLIQSAEEIVFSGILSRLVGFGLVFLHCVC